MEGVRRRRRKRRRRKRGAKKRRPRWLKRSACYYLNAMVEAFCPFVDSEGMMKRSSGGRAIAGDFEDDDLAVDDC